MAFRIETALPTSLPRDADGRHRGFPRGADIDLSDPQVHRQVCVAGIAGPEPDGAWTQEASARVTIILADDEAQEIAIWIAAAPFVTERHFQVVAIAWNGIPLGQVRLGWDHAGRQVLKLVRPVEAASEDWARIDLSFRNIASPASEGLSGDARPLGLKLARLAITDADAPPPPGFDVPAFELRAPPPAVIPGADAMRRLEEQTRRLEDRLDRIVEELGTTRRLAEQAQADASRVATALNRATGRAG